MMQSLQKCELSDMQAARAERGVVELGDHAVGPSEIRARARQPNHRLPGCFEVFRHGIHGCLYLHLYQHNTFFWGFSATNSMYIHLYRQESQTTKEIET